MDFHKTCMNLHLSTSFQVEYHGFEPVLVSPVCFCSLSFYGGHLCAFSKNPSDDEGDNDFKPKKRGRPGRKKATTIAGVEDEDDDEASVGGTPSKGTPQKPLVQGQSICIQERLKGNSGGKVGWGGRKVESIR